MKLVIEERNKNRIDKLIRKAGFPSIKTLDNYEFSPITFPQGLNKETLLTLDFIDNRENVLMLGAVGTGKTHLSIALEDMAEHIGRGTACSDLA
ncbi:MAG: ATP-binding protein [Bacillota bacterium]